MQGRGTTRCRANVMATGMSARSASSRLRSIAPDSHHAVPGEDDRPLGAVDQVHRLPAARRPTREARAGSRAGAPGLPSQTNSARGLLGVLGDVHQHRPGAAAGARHVERLVDGRRHLGHVRHQVIVLRDGEGDAGDVGLLEGVRPDEPACPPDRDATMGEGIEHREGGDARDHVGGPGPGTWPPPPRPRRSPAHSRRPCGSPPARARTRTWRTGVLQPWRRRRAESRRPDNRTPWSPPRGRGTPTGSARRFSCSPLVRTRSSRGASASSPPIAALGSPLAPDQPAGVGAVLRQPTNPPIVACGSAWRPTNPSRSPRRSTAQTPTPS